MISMRSRLSLYQLLTLQSIPLTVALLKKHGAWTHGLEEFYEPNTYYLKNLEIVILGIEEQCLMKIIKEIITTRRTIKNSISPGYRFDERWGDLEKCLELDGYLIQDNDLMAFEPTIEASMPIEDDLSSELRKSNLPKVSEIMTLIENSADDFKKSPADYNGCLFNMRTALETLAKDMACELQKAHGSTFDKEKWGSTISYIKQIQMITQNEEEALAGVYKLLSSAHRPIGLSESEMARLGRSIAASMCYFLIKIYNNFKP